MTPSSKSAQHLEAHEIVRLARHPKRPNALEIIQKIASKFIELKGDRNFHDDQAMLCGLALIDGMQVVVVANQKGRGTKENIQRNFGMSRPEGYRKALRIMSMAERLSLPILTLVDTPGAYPGIGAEERGQSEAIAKNILVMSRLQTPSVTMVIGEGGSGGALAIAVADKVFMLENAIYSVISPEGCASILFSDAQKAPEAAANLKVTAKDCQRFGIIDGIVPEGKGGAHENPDLVCSNIKKTVLQELRKLQDLLTEERLNVKQDRYLKIGNDFIESASG